MQHLAPLIKSVREATVALYLELPTSVADDVKARVEKLLSGFEAYQSAVDLLLTAISQEGAKPDFTPEFKGLIDAANQLRRQAPNSPFTGPELTGFYWVVHKETGKVTVGELVKGQNGDVSFSNPAVPISNRSFSEYFWVGPLSSYIKLPT